MPSFVCLVFLLTNGHEAGPEDEKLENPMDIFDYAPRRAAKIEGRVDNREKTPVPASLATQATQEPSFCLREATPEAYGAGMEVWARERCIFRDGRSGRLGALHTDYVAWCNKVGRGVRSSFCVFKKLLEESGFTITDDGRVSGLILMDHVRAFQKSRIPSPLHRGA